MISLISDISGGTCSVNDSGNSSRNFSGNSGGVSERRLAPVSGDAAPELTPASTFSAQTDRLTPLLLVLLSATALSACGGGGGGGPAVAVPQAPDKKPDTKRAPEAQDSRPNPKPNTKPARGPAPQECLAPNVSTSDFIFL